jgi:hypothetical protein
MRWPSEKANLDWKYITNLHDLQENACLRSGNRVTEQVINFSKNKMKVLFAVRVFSESTAAAIDSARMKHNESGNFNNSEGFTKFLRIIDQLFDLLNSKCPYVKERW